ncbi:MAG: hypothetical protein EB824_03290 [Thaumarchaeota archaeon S15]|nr:MAG: hypothetical protein EB824_03290 [Thaumarchaeota archaeon S15]
MQRQGTASRVAVYYELTKPKKARNFGLALAGASIAMAMGISATATPEQGAWATAFIAFGLLNNVLVYSYALKRRTWSNILLGGLCGGSPAMVGWAAVTLSDLWTMGLAMAGLVFIWIPLHIWSLTLHFRSDYRAVGVPMLTAVRTEGASARIIAASTVAMVAFSMVPLLVTLEGGGPAVGPVYLWTAAASGALMVAAL